MGRRWVVNASPLILLGKVDHANLLVDLTDELIVPDAVVREVRVKQDGERVLNKLTSLPTVRAASEITISREVEA